MKKPKTQHEPTGPVHVKSYRYNPSNVFAHMQMGQIGVDFLFNRTHTFAILDRRPASSGHALLVVKHPVATMLSELPLDVMGEIMHDLQVLCAAVQAATNCDGFVVQQNNGPAAGQTVPQLHFHVQPCYTGSKLLAPEERKELAAEEAGPLIARIRNLLPEAYSPGLHVWAACSDAMEDVGASLQQHLLAPGMVLQLVGQLGSGKTTVARGFVRSFCSNRLLDVPSPTFLLCLSYQEDLGHDAAARAEPQQQPSVHHMDPYRLGANADKMAGLIDFENAFTNDVCVIEWPDRMPKEVMALKRKGLEVTISGIGVQGVGRLLQMSPLTPEDPCAEVLRKWRTTGLPTAQELAGPRSTEGLGKELLFPAAGVLSKNRDEWLVLGIESSCDDTAAAVVRGDGHVLAHKIASQVGLHEQYGGVKPDVARQAHADAIHSVVDSCLEAAGVAAQQLTAVAVTVGPGLALCLQVGVRHALSIASEHHLPFIPIHHMEAHALITRMPGIMASPMTFPALLLLVSGGHNMLVLCEGVGRYRVIGTTLDDSIGECFDKVARLLGITTIPGGPKLEKMADAGDPSSYKLTMPMQTGLYKDSCNFSFSGLKTGVSKLLEEERARMGAAADLAEATHGNGTAARAAAAEGSGAMTANGGSGSTPDAATSASTADTKTTAADPTPDPLDTVKPNIAATFQSVCVKFLKQRTLRALQWLKQDCAQHGGQMVTCLVVAGGVAANKSVRAGMEEVAREFGIPCVYPPIKYCTDNGLMVAWTGIERLQLGLYKQALADASAIDNHVEVVPRWPIGPLDPRSSVKRGATSKMYH